MKTFDNKYQVILSGLQSEIQSLIDNHESYISILESQIKDTELLEDMITDCDKVYSKNLKFIQDIIQEYKDKAPLFINQSIPLVNPDYLKSFVK